MISLIELECQLAAAMNSDPVETLKTVARVLFNWADERPRHKLWAFKIVRLLTEQCLIVKTELWQQDISTVQAGQKMWEIWAEGFQATGETGFARLVGSARAASFKDACIRFFEAHPTEGKLFDRERLTLWGCRLFDNKRDAQKEYG